MLNIFKKQDTQIFDGIEEEKKQKILLEIRMLKIQSTISILTAIGAVLAFIILNWTQILSFIPDPEFKLSIEDDLILREGTVSVVKIEDNTPIISCSAQQAAEGLTVKPGAYKISLSYQAQEIWSGDYVFERGRSRTLPVPPQFTGNIQVFVDTNTTNILPGAMLDLKIDATGNGYLWVYELTKENRYSRSYPLSSSTLHHGVRVEEPFRFPDKEGLAFFAGEQEGEETLLFVVTSKNDGDFADNIAKRMTQLTLGKSYVKQRESNWGVAKITYHVKKP